MVGKLVCVLLLATSLTAKGKPGQLVPDAKRQKEIRTALVEHGYESGKTWVQTQDILREIARVHHWQGKHAPDARVLILLGLGNKYSDPSVVDWPMTKLETTGRE